MTCGQVSCLGPASVTGIHALKHFSHKCTLALNCRDSHIYCTQCQMYVYPRELGGSEACERALTPAVEEWLQVLGRQYMILRHARADEVLIVLHTALAYCTHSSGTRLWWRECPGAVKLSGPGVRGLTNFGNTCYFSSTVQVCARHAETTYPTTFHFAAMPAGNFAHSPTA